MRAPLSCPRYALRQPGGASHATQWSQVPHTVEGILVAFPKARQLSRAWIPVVTGLGILTLQQLLRQVAARTCT